MKRRLPISDPALAEVMVGVVGADEPVLATNQTTNDPARDGRVKVTPPVDQLFYASIDTSNG